VSENSVAVGSRLNDAEGTSTPIPGRAIFLSALYTQQYARNFATIRARLEFAPQVNMVTRQKCQAEYRLKPQVDVNAPCVMPCERNKNDA
jgi:hypothetical protein